MRIFPAFIICAALLTGYGTAFAEPTYDDLKSDLKPQNVESPTQLRKHLDAMDGAAVEMQGEITGIMVRANSKLIMLKVGDDMALLSAPTKKNEPLLRTGNQIRVIARVDASSKDDSVVILAVAPPASDGEVVAALPRKEDDSLPQPPDVPIVITTGDVRPQPNPLSSRKGGPKVVPVTPARIKPQPKAAPAAAPDGPVTFDIEAVVQQQKASYAGIVRRHNKKLNSQTVNEIAEALLRAGFKYQMDPRFLAAIIAVESDFDVNCLSSSGAMGLGQLMKFNLKEAGVSDPWNPTQNINGTAKLLRGHLNDYKDRPNGTLLAVAAYNAGPGAVRRAGYKVPPGDQVQRYVWKVYYRYKSFAPDMFN